MADKMDWQKVFMNFNIGSAIMWANQGSVDLAKIRLKCTQSNASEYGIAIPEEKLKELNEAYKHGAENSLHLAEMRIREQDYNKAKHYLERAKNCATEIGLDISVKVCEIVDGMVNDK